MKYFKSFILLATVTLLAACSSDKAGNNTMVDTVAGFASTEITVKENVGYFNVPISITGVRNGNVKLTVEVIPDATNPAIEDEHYLITTKTLTLLASDNESETLNVQIKTVDDSEINEARKFKLKIINIEGATLTNDEVTITLRDNDAAFFEKFFGKWDITFTDHDGVVQTKTVTITGPSDEEDPDYNNILTATCPAMFNVGVELDCEWHFRYSFDASTKQGTLSFILGEVIATYSTAYRWVWACDDGVNYTYDDITTSWQLGENDTFPTTITWQPDQYMYLLMTNGFWDTVENISMTKQ